jgi:DNA modification methylase
MLAPSPKPQFIIQTGDCLALLKTYPDRSVHCCVTSPPYFGLRDYGHAGQIGLEATPDAFVAEMVAVFREVRRVLRDDGTLWLNLGDSYAGSWGAQSRPNGNDNGSTLQGGSMLSARQIEAHPKRALTGSIKNTPGCKPKDLIGIPWRVAFALQADGWYLRQDIIWSKPNPLPESVTDRCTKSHEYIFLLSKSARYYYDSDLIKEPVATDEAAQRVKNKTRNEQRGKGDQEGVYNARGKVAPFSNWKPTRNKRSVWTVAPKPFKQAHFATFPPALIEPCVLAGCPLNGIVLDPFGGAGTTGLVATENGRRALLIELNSDYAAMADKRIRENA